MKRITSDWVSTRFGFNHTLRDVEQVLFYGEWWPKLEYCDEIERVFNDLMDYDGVYTDEQEAFIFKCTNSEFDHAFEENLND